MVVNMHKEIEEIRACVNVVEEKLEKLEKLQIKFGLMTIVMWTALGGTAVLIIQYIFSLVAKK